MHTITDITSLGDEYTITAPAGGHIGTIQIVTINDILSATLGPYTESFGSYDNYMQTCVTFLSGFEKIKPTNVLWYASSSEEVVWSDVIEYALNNGYTTVILEYLRDLE